MLGYIGLHRGLSRAALVAGVAALAALGGCATTSPSVKVLGVQQARQAPTQKLLVFVEVVNPTNRDLTLSRLEYHVRASSWFETRGQVTVTRQIGAGSSAVVEIPVPVTRRADREDGSIPYILEGKLFAREDRMERSWDVAVRGALGAEVAGAGAPVRVTVAGE